MRVSFLFAWYDLWIGAYWDRANRRLYVLPLPMLGVVFDFGHRGHDAWLELAMEDEITRALDLDREKLEQLRPGSAGPTAEDLGL